MKLQTLLFAKSLPEECQSLAGSAKEDVTLGLVWSHGWLLREAADFGVACEEHCCPRAGQGGCGLRCAQPDSPAWGLSGHLNVSLDRRQSP